MYACYVWCCSSAARISVSMPSAVRRPRLLFQHDAASAYCACARGAPPNACPRACVVLEPSVRRFVCLRSFRSFDEDGGTDTTMRGHLRTHLHTCTSTCNYCPRARPCVRMRAHVRLRCCAAAHPPQRRSGYVRQRRLVQGLGWVGGLSYVVARVDGSEKEKNEENGWKTCEDAHTAGPAYNHA
jgi:hypothetical protein